MVFPRRPRTPAMYGYLLSIVLVPLYVSMFPVWKLLSVHLSDAMLTLLPIGVSVIGLAGALCWYQTRRLKIKDMGNSTVITGLVLCVCALLLPDPHYPAKRIHVAEYMLLSLVVNWAMSHHLQGRSLLFSGAYFASLLGVHDEMLQGMVDSRTFGLRDIGVNALAAAGGALIWYGLRLFQRPGVPHLPLSGITRWYLLWLGIGVAALIWPLFFLQVIDPAPVAGHASAGRSGAVLPAAPPAPSRRWRDKLGGIDTCPLSAVQHYGADCFLLSYIFSDIGIKKYRYIKYDYETCHEAWYFGVCHRSLVAIVAARLV